MAELECQSCKSLFTDVLWIKKCPLCGSREFSKVEPLMGSAVFPKWFTYGGNMGYAYSKTLRLDESAEV